LPVPTKNPVRRRLGDLCFTIIVGEVPGFQGVRGRGNKVNEINWHEVFGRDSVYLEELVRCCENDGLVKMYTLDTIYTLESIQLE